MIFVLVLLTVGRVVLGAAVVLPISEVLTDVIDLVLATDGRLLTGLPLEIGDLGFVIFVLVLLVGRVVLGAALRIWLDLTVDILLEEKLVRR